jgi:hypothetical protein
VPEDLGLYVGQVAFEQARGILMELCGYTADEALSALGAFTHRSGLAVEDTVRGLRVSPTVFGPMVCP